MILLGPDLPLLLLGLEISVSVDLLMSAGHTPQSGDSSAGHAHIDMYSLTVLWFAHCASCSWSAAPACWSSHRSNLKFYIL